MVVGTLLDQTIKTMRNSTKNASLVSHTGEDYIGPEYLEMPLSPPRIQQESGSFLIGSRLDLNCTSVLSYPPIYLQWLVNNREVSAKCL